MDCILNGRLNPENNNFTSISVRGKAVVDYIVTSHADMKTCLGFNVYTPSELIDRVGPESFNLIIIVDSLTIQFFVYVFKWERYLILRIMLTVHSMQKDKTGIILVIFSLLRGVAGPYWR